MKKVLIFLTVFCFCVLFQTGCGLNIDSAVNNNLSEIRKNVFEGQTDTLKVSCMSGERENPYTYDGVSEEKCEFGIITVNFKEFVGAINVPFVATIDDKKFEGTLEKSPFNENYMVDIESVADDEAKILISINDEPAIELQNISSTWEIDWQKALTLGKTYLSEELNAILSNGKFEAECYLKPVTDEGFISGQYFWSFFIVDKNFVRYTVVLDVNSGDMLVKNKTI